MMQLSPVPHSSKTGVSALQARTRHSNYRIYQADRSPRAGPPHAMFHVKQNAALLSICRMLLSGRRSRILIAPLPVADAVDRVHRGFAGSFLDLAPDAKIWVEPRTGGGFPSWCWACALATFRKGGWSPHEASTKRRHSCASRVSCDAITLLLGTASGWEFREFACGRLLTAPGGFSPRSLLLGHVGRS